ncbi:Uncharacterized protein Fot_37173 [Forsythia ovata]|uniref:Uncharacterized protein n=1 Tax=Forsythia ovata TaxID=205694 RepID=A0ABD1SRN6_9LAMI
MSTRLNIMRFHENQEFSTSVMVTMSTKRKDFYRYCHILGHHIRECRKRLRQIAYQNSNPKDQTFKTTTVITNVNSSSNGTAIRMLETLLNMVDLNTIEETLDKSELGGKFRLKDDLDFAAGKMTAQYAIYLRWSKTECVDCEQLYKVAMYVLSQYLKFRDVRHCRCCGFEK